MKHHTRPPDCPTRSPVLLDMADVTPTPDGQHAERAEMCFRRGFHRIVGFSVLSTKAPNSIGPGYFARRIFWLAPHDRDSVGTTYRTGAPMEACDPRTAHPGVPGELTERAWGRSLSAISHGRGRTEQPAMIDAGADDATAGLTP
jgi:hypothetical protein